jgi:hypothetical protein
MGLCLGTSSGFKINDKKGQDKMASRFFQMIALEKYEVSVFYSIFLEFDLKETGTFKTDALYHKYR